MTKYYKVLGEGLRTNFGYQWKPGKWNIVPEKEINPDEYGFSCGSGLHVFIDKPNWNYYRYLPDHTYKVVAVSGLLGADSYKARFRKVKLALLPLTLNDLLGNNRDGLKGACLARADLSHSNLSGSDLSGTYLMGADLSDSNLVNANLSGANLKGANLIGANLTGADLSGTILADLGTSEIKMVRI